MNEKVVQLSSASFAEEIDKYSGVAVVDFWAPWCGPCRAIGPIIDELAIEYEGKVKVAKVNIDDHPELAERFNVSSIPRVLFFSEGELKDTLIGAAPKRKFVDAISKFVR